MLSQEMMDEFHVAMGQAMIQGLWMAAKLLWPYFLIAFLFVLAMVYLKATTRRAELDREYRRMARTVWDEQNPGSVSTRRLVMCPDCRREGVASYAPQTGVPTYCDECYRRRLE